MWLTELSTAVQVERSYCVQSSVFCGCWAEKYEIKCADNANRPLYIVRYSDAQIAEIRRVINQADLDTKDISPQKVTNAIMRSFAISDGSPVPRMDGQC